MSDNTTYIDALGQTVYESLTSFDDTVSNNLQVGEDDASASQTITPLSVDASAMDTSGSTSTTDDSNYYSSTGIS